MTIDWMKVGLEHNGTPDQKERILFAVSNMKWQKIGNGLSLPMMPGLGIKECIKHFKIPKVSQVAISHEFAPFGLCGIQGRYINGDVQIIVIDEGDAMCPLCAIKS